MPLQTLFGDSTANPTMGLRSSTEMGKTLPASNYTFRYIPGRDIGHADAMSRLTQAMKP